MVNCTFCGDAIKPGTGKMLALKDGKIQYFCTMKCEKNLWKLNRKPRTTKWTKAHAVQKAADIAARAHASAAPSPASEQAQAAAPKPIAPKKTAPAKAEAKAQ